MTQTNGFPRSGQRWMGFPKAGRPWLISFAALVFFLAVAGWGFQHGIFFAFVIFHLQFFVIGVRSKYIPLGVAAVPVLYFLSMKNLNFLSYTSILGIVVWCVLYVKYGVSPDEEPAEMAEGSSPSFMGKDLFKPSRAEKAGWIWIASLLLLQCLGFPDRFWAMGFFLPLLLFFLLVYAIQEARSKKLAVVCAICPAILFMLLQDGFDSLAYTSILGIAVWCVLYAKFGPKRTADAEDGDANIDNPQLQSSNCPGGADS